MKANKTAPLFLCLLLAGCGSGSTHNLDNYLPEAKAVRWQQPEVRYFIAPQSSSVPGLDLPPAVDRGITAWRKPLTGRLTLTRTTDPAQSDITIRFGVRDEVGTRQDFVNLSYDNSGRFLRRAEIVLYRGLTPPSLTAAATHSTGHALGLRAHSGVATDVMWHYPHVLKPLSERDENTIQALYPSP
jgi:predicted Zn-dependent protease